MANINNISKKHIKATVEFKDISNLDEAIEAIARVINEFTVYKDELNASKSYSKEWEGESKKVFEELVNFQTQYVKKFPRGLKELEKALKYAKDLDNKISSANVIEEVKSI